jgi:ketosteroid isomerase-like protein
MLERAHPEMEARPTLGILYDHSVYVGHAGIRAWFEEVAARWPGFDPHVEELREVDDRVIAFIHLSAESRGQPVDARFAVEHTFRDGRMATLYGRDLWEVREELGLEEPP